MTEEIKESKPVEVKKSVIEEAKEAAEAIRKANEELKAALEERRTLEILGGRSEGGFVEKVLDPKEAQRERINNILKPTGMHI